MIGVDTNVLAYAVNSQCPEHEACREVIQGMRAPVGSITVTGRAGRSVIVPPTTSRSASVKPVGASLKVKVTSELASVSLRDPSAMATVTVGLVRSMVTLSLPEPPRFSVASV